MNNRNRTRMVGLGLILAATFADAQSLAEAAKREKERQARARASAPPAKVYSDGSAGDAADGSGSSDSAKGAFTVMERTSTSEPGAADARPLPAVTPAPPRAGSSRSSATADRPVSVTLYMTSWCPYCRRAREMLSSMRNVRLTMYDIEQDRSKNKEMLVKTRGKTAIPVIDVQGLVIQGFSREAIEQAISLMRGN